MIEFELEISKHYLRYSGLSEIRDGMEKLIKNLKKQTSVLRRRCDLIELIQTKGAAHIQIGLITPFSLVCLLDPRPSLAQRVILINVTYNTTHLITYLKRRALHEHNIEIVSARIHSNQERQRLRKL